MEEQGQEQAASGGSGLQPPEEEQVSYVFIFFSKNHKTLSWKHSDKLRKTRPKCYTKFVFLQSSVPALRKEKASFTPKSVERQG